MSKSLKIVYYPAAQDDIKGILNYISMDNPSAAISLIGKIDETIGSLSMFPHAGTIPSDNNLKSKNYRMLIIDSYIAFYIINETLSSVEIMRILSGRQNYINIL
ncbi:MAG: type II toxin-antitoxin system mRNA interferase toxin, RelE/StbE family [Firmicutes bacterium HGW-Firmicutes-1]|jgi:toxin ParE1/3/4|nr:MAG: type II toxin-antitoxin system mRNA interferase toxin, RelE/StbE family [Firmicutes bacterium HGW-Firmicutes-1]